ncbi:MAG TPA: lipopolysaccharide heptosyltransferase II [Burkholderiales bacterium]|nr:lipopolysaccharide heptosyltransferase II [Burkholderiales bacterium]
MKLLVIGPAWVGDMVLAQSLFKLLKQRYPTAELDVVAPAWTLPLLERMPEVDNPVALDAGHGELALGKRLALGERLEAREYERAIVLPNSFKSAIVPWIAGAQRRTGFLGELRYGLLNDIRKLDKKALPRTVDRFVALGLEPDEVLKNAPPLPQLISNRQNALHALNAVGHALSQVPVLGLCPGAEYGPSKRWPAQYFAQLAAAKLAQGWEVWLFGSNKDAPITEAIDRATGGRCLNLGSRTSLAEAIDLLALTQVVVSNDSGLMHVAAALGRRLVALFGSTDPGFTPPMSPNAKVIYLGLPCSPCFKRDCPLKHHKCLKDIGPKQVLAAIQR